MGFGPLLIGYFTQYVISLGMGPFAFAGMLIGFSLMLWAIWELKDYCPTFIYSLVTVILLLICGVYETAAYIDSMLLLNIGIFDPNVMFVFDCIEFGLNFAFNFTLLFAIADLSKRVDYLKTRNMAFSNMVFVAGFNIFQLIILIPGIIPASEKGFFQTLLIFAQLLYTILNTILIFRCYAMICPEGEEDMPRKPSRFAFINKLRAKQDEKDEKAIQRTKEYVEKKLKLNNTNQTKKTKKKKKK